MLSRKKSPSKNDALNLQRDTGRSWRDTTHNDGETTGMFRARTAEAIRVEMEKDVDVDQLPESLRRLMRTFGAR